MLTNEQADATYQQAFAALHGIVIDPAATPEQKALAREKRELLTLEYIGQAIASVEERSRKFRTFIGEMNAVIAAFGSGSTIAGIRRLRKVVDVAGELIGSALAPLAPAAGAKQAAKKTVKKTVKKAAKRKARKAAKRPAKKAVKTAPKRAPKRALKKSPKKAPMKAPGKVPKKATKKATKKAAKKLAKKATKKAAGARRRVPVPKKGARSAEKSPGRAARRRVR